MSGPDDPSGGTPSTDAPAASEAPATEPPATEAPPNEAPAAAPPPEAAPPPKPEMGQVGRIVGAFVSPGKLFADIARKPSFVLPLVLFAALGVTSGIVSAKKVDVGAFIQQRMERSGQKVDQKAIDRAVALSKKTSFVRPVATVIVVPVVFLFLGAVFWLGLKLSGSDIGFVHAFSTTIYGYLPGALTGGLVALVVMLRQTTINPMNVQHLVKGNLAAFLPEHVNAGLRAIAGSIDVFNIWIIVLLVIGFSIVGKIKKGKAAAVVIGIWVIGVLVKAGWALLMHHFMG